MAANIGHRRDFVSVQEDCNRFSLIRANNFRARIFHLTQLGNREPAIQFGSIRGPETRQSRKHMQAGYQK